ncbi:uncharacterized protein QC761_0001930 [Podospora bellae-mahoneyi]|uniref:Uncharacterized protein n=1 Tax=Podospora bellae-mahoneyi TaxID=2093777 RepID=A0ABR0FXG9_9PEZI|nr:hypothetical protein QC761_0001930 [Podospora bellae-mahoneyi]
MDNFGRSMRLDSNVTTQRLAEVGFVDIKEEVIRIPFNPWPTDTYSRDIGRWFNLVMKQGFQPLCLAPFARGLNKSFSEINDFVEEVKAEAHLHSEKTTVSLARLLVSTTFLKPLGYNKSTPVG